jgi:hypothetical protein
VKVAAGRVFSQSWNDLAKLVQDWKWMVYLKRPDDNPSECK